MTSPPPSLNKKVGIASVIMMSSVLASRLVGILRESVIAGIGGASSEVDAYQVAFVVPEILNHIVASGFLSVTFIPIFTAYLVRHQEKEGWRIFSVIFTCFGCLLVILCLLCFILAPQLIDLAAHGRTDPEFKRLAVRMTRIIIPAQFFFFSGGMFMAVQFAKEKFSVPAVAPVVYNLGIISGGTLLGPWLGMEGFSWGVLAGAFVGSFAVQLWAAKNVGLHFRITFDFHHPDLKKYVLLTLPLMVGLTMMFSMEIFMRFFWLVSTAGQHCRVKLRQNHISCACRAFRSSGRCGLISISGPPLRGRQYPGNEPSDEQHPEVPGPGDTVFGSVDGSKT